VQSGTSSGLLYYYSNVFKGTRRKGIFW